MRKNTLITLIDLKSHSKEPDLEKLGGVYAMEVRLHYPRPNVAERVALRGMGAGRASWDWAQSPLSTRLLFKETLEGPVGVTINLFRSDSNAALNQWLLELFGSAIEMGGDIGAAQVPGPARGLIREAADTWADSLNKKGGRQLIARAQGTLKKLPKKNAAKQTFSLQATRDWKRTTVTGPSKARKRRTELLLKGGVSLGELTLELKGI